MKIKHILVVVSLDDGSIREVLLSTAEIEVVADIISSRGVVRVADIDLSEVIKIGENAYNLQKDKP